MEDIINSIINGQRKQALEQLIDSPYLLEDLFEELLSQGMARGTPADKKSQSQNL